MSALQQAQDDLHFIRQAVERRSRTAPGPAPIYVLWAAYVLVGYTLMDFYRPAAGIFFAAGGIAGGALSWALARRHAARAGQRESRDDRQAALHFGGGVVLGVLAVAAMSATVPVIRDTLAGQFMVIIIGLVYFTAGAHFDRNFLWLGPVVAAGGVGVGLVPSHGWTALGVVIAAGLVLPTLLPASRRRGSAE